MWLELCPFVRLGIPSTWFFGYQFERGTPPERNLVLCIIPPFAVAIDLGSAWHRFTCTVCYPQRWRLNFWR